MSYSKKQKLFAEFMLKKIGIVSQIDLEIYLSHLEKLYGKLVSFPSQRSYNSSVWHYSVSDCIDLIKQEIDVKKLKHTIDRVNPKSTFSATDLANYEYCPASFAISNSFQIDNPSGKEFTEMGLQLHEQLLSARTKWNSEDGVNYTGNDLTTDAVRNCRLIFAGHTEKDTKFINGNWIGIPDYIFQDTDGQFFVVEEKFHKKKDPQKMTSHEWMDDKYGGGIIDEEAEKARKEWANYIGYFFSNHIVQIVSYMKNIAEYKIAYGYLLYWYYDFKADGQPYIHKVVTKKILLNEGTEKLYLDAVNGIGNLKRTQHSYFEIEKLNMKKCAGCVVGKYCGHKTRKFNYLTFPYDYKFLNLQFVAFPEELKKE